MIRLLFVGKDHPCNFIDVRMSIGHLLVKGESRPGAVFHGLLVQSNRLKFLPPEEDHAKMYSPPSMGEVGSCPSGLCALRTTTSFACSEGETTTVVDAIIGAHQQDVGDGAISILPSLRVKRNGYTIRDQWRIFAHFFFFLFLSLWPSVLMQGRL